MLRQGRSIEKLDSVIRTLADGETLDVSLRDHSLSGSFRGHRECHIEPDWLLIYRYELISKLSSKQASTFAKATVDTLAVIAPASKFDNAGHPVRLLSNFDASARHLLPLWREF